MFIPLRELIADWQDRLRACRAALFTAREDHPSFQLLLIHERVLSYLLARYTRDPEAEARQLQPPQLPTALRPQQAPSYWLTPPPLAEPSRLHPPRSTAELRVHLRGIHAALVQPSRSKPWLLRRRARR